VAGQVFYSKFKPSWLNLLKVCCIASSAELDTSMCLESGNHSGYKLLPNNAATECTQNMGSAGNHCCSTFVADRQCYSYKVSEKNKPTNTKTET
jgi:hypothetical protein